MKAMAGMSCWQLILLALVLAGVTGCTGANLKDPTYNTKQLLIHDPRSSP